MIYCVCMYLRTNYMCTWSSGGIYLILHYQKKTTTCKNTPKIRNQAELNKKVLSPNILSVFSAERLISSKNTEHESILQHHCSCECPLHQLQNKAFLLSTPSCP